MNTITITTYESATQITAVVSANNIDQPVLGLAFDLLFDPYLLSYLSYEEGAYFESGGDPIYLVTNSIDHQGGKVITGITLKRTEQPVDSSGTIIAFNFDILDKTDTELIFKNPIISKINDQGEREDLDYIEWIDQEVNFARTVVETTPVETPPTQETETGTGSVEEELPTISEIGSANIFEAESTLLLPIILTSLPLLLLICYIAWRKLKKRYAVKTTNPSITEPPPEETSSRDWA